MSDAFPLLEIEAEYQEFLTFAKKSCPQYAAITREQYRVFTSDLLFLVHQLPRKKITEKEIVNSFPKELEPIVLVNIERFLKVV